MNRRDAIKAVSVIMGGTMVGANAFLSGCTAKGDDKKINELFLSSDIKLLDEVGDTILPTTDSPGAKAANIGGFMAMMVVDCYEPADQKAFTEGLKTLKKDYKAQYGKEFVGAPSEDRTAFLNAMDKAQKEYTRANRNNRDTPPHYFRMVKELTLLGYFTSEIGCTQAMRYVAVPGRYEGCIDYKKGDKAWAS